MQFQADNSPFTQPQAELLNQLTPTLTPDQMQWLSGYFSGMRSATGGAESDRNARTRSAENVSPAPASTEPLEVTVLFGSQTGNAMGLAERLSERLEHLGVQVAMSCMSDFKPRALAKVRQLLVVVSTHGEGDPPDKSIAFHEFLHGKRAPKLEGTRFSVLALGDLSYEKYCQTGKDIDHRLEELGAERLFPRTDCDVDYDEAADSWIDGVIAVLTRETRMGDGASSAMAQSIAAPDASAASPEAASFSRTNPFPAEVLENINLNGRGSDKETRHIELSIEGSGFRFEPGDSLGIVPQNPPALVNDLIHELNFAGDELVRIGDQDRQLRDALTQNCEITVLTKPLLERAAEFSQNGLKSLLHEDRIAELRAYLQGRDLIDLVRDHTLVGVSASEFVSMLRKLPPRLYSIASSYRANPDEVHLTIAAVRYHAHERDRHGVCSVQCAERATSGDLLPVYVNRNPNFRLPSGPDSPMIMVGPGTGVAPFRAFIEEREEVGAKGRNWLFFGDRRFQTDFLYQTEWLRWLESGVLTRMDVAFSRDTDEKVYVQHRMLENGKELFGWLEDGASLYVCGDERQMAADVHTALEAIVAQYGGFGMDAAKSYVRELQEQGRYQRDVY
jgi:sulfite reductase (NADPH) flavoprotein alpha-component